MAVILSKGYILPQTGDKGSVWFPALEDDIEQLNSHNHDGVNSEQIPGSSIASGTADILPADWVAFGTGYRFLVTLPSGFTVDGSHKEFRLVGAPADGGLIFPTIEKVSANTMYVYSNDATITVKVSLK